MYKISEGMKEAVLSKNMKAVHSRFFSLIARSPSGAEIKANCDYCLNNGLSEEELYQPESGQVFNETKDGWTKAYWTKLGSEMQSDFSKKRLQHMIDVADFLFPEPSVSDTAEAKKKSAAGTAGAGSGDSNSLLWLIVGAAAAVLLGIWIFKK